MPDNLRCTKNDTDKSREAKRKKVKALKLTHKTQIQEQCHKSRQNEWLSFQKKASHTSIFKSPETVDGKVGVVNSGHQMTNTGFKPLTRPNVLLNLGQPSKRPKYS